MGPGRAQGFVYHFVGLKNDLHQVKKQLLIFGGSCKIIFSPFPQSELSQKAQLEANSFISFSHSEFSYCLRL